MSTVMGASGFLLSVCRPTAAIWAATSIPVYDPLEALHA